MSAPNPSPPAQPPLRLYLVGGAVAAIVAAVIALVVVLVATPVYRASTNVSIRPRIADLGAAEASARLIRNYAAWVDSEAYAARLSGRRSAAGCPTGRSSGMCARTATPTACW